MDQYPLYNRKSYEEISNSNRNEFEQKWLDDNKKAY